MTRTSLRIIFMTVDDEWFEILNVGADVKTLKDCKWLSDWLVGFYYIP